MDRIPAIFEHCRTIWFAMREESQNLPVDSDGTLMPVYEGFLTKLFARNHLSTPYYSQVMTLLQSMDTVRQLRRGGGSAPSQWVLLQEPTTELYNALLGKPTKTSYKGGAAEPTSKQNAQQIRDLNRRVTTLENGVRLLLNQMGVHEQSAEMEDLVMDETA